MTTRNSCMSSGYKLQCWVHTYMYSELPAKRTLLTCRQDGSVHSCLSIVCMFLCVQEFESLRRNGCEYKPVLEPQYEEAEAWAILQERWSL